MTDIALIMHPTQPPGVGCLGCICIFEDLRLYAGYMLIIWLHCIQPWLLQANDVRGYHMIFPQVVCQKRNPINWRFPKKFTAHLKSGGKIVQEEPGYYRLML